MLLCIIIWIDNYYTSHMRGLENWSEEKLVVRVTIIDCNVNLLHYNRGCVAFRYYGTFDRPCAIYRLSIVVRFIRVWNCGTGNDSDCGQGHELIDFLCDKVTSQTETIVDDSQLRNRFTQIYVPVLFCFARIHEHRIVVIPTTHGRHCISIPLQKRRKELFQSALKHILVSRTVNRGNRNSKMSMIKIFQW